MNDPLSGQIGPWDSSGELPLLKSTLIKQPARVRPLRKQAKPPVLRPVRTVRAMPVANHQLKKRSLMEDFNQSQEIGPYKIRHSLLDSSFMRSRVLPVPKHGTRLKREVSLPNALQQYVPNLLGSFNIQLSMILMNKVQQGVVTGFSFFFSLYQLIDKAIALYRHSALLKLLLRARVYRPDELLALKPGKGAVWVAVEGLLRSGNPVITEDHSKLIYLITLLREKSWLSSLSQIIVSQKQFAQDLFLQDPSGVGQLGVQGIKNADLSRSIECFSSTLIQQGTGRKGLLLLILKLLIKKEFDFSYLKGQSKIVENGIKDADLVTLLGQLRANPDHSYSLRDVRVVSRSKQSIIQHLKLLICRSSLVGAGFLLLFMAASYFAANMVINTLKQRRLQRSAQQEVSEEIACIVCRQRARDVLFEPCLHVCVCRTCTASLPRSECPVCKSWIQKQVRVAFD